MNRGEHRETDEEVIQGLDRLIVERDTRITELEEALLHLLEVQNAPSFTRGTDHELYDRQSKEWLDACNDARRALRGQS